MGRSGEDSSRVGAEEDIGDVLPMVSLESVLEGQYLLTVLFSRAQIRDGAWGNDALGLLLHKVSSDGLNEVGG
jgi:hypothetical protein